MNLMEMLYGKYTPPNVPGRIHLLKDDPAGKASDAMVKRWADPEFRAKKKFESPKRNAIVAGFSGRSWITVQQLARKINTDMAYVQRVAVEMYRDGKLERRYAKGSLVRCYEYRKVSDAS